jgi:malate dehydrogenase (oxaloacetate-decarboxylating)
VVNKKIGDVKIAFIGTGASNVAISRLVFGSGADPAKCLMVDSKGILGKHRKDLEMRKAEYVDKWRLCQITNAEGREGNIPDAIKGSDVVIAPSRSDRVLSCPNGSRQWQRFNCIVCANPVPEIWPWEAKAAGAVVSYRPF